MSTKSMWLLVPVIAVSLVAVSGCARQSELDALRTDVASLRTEIMKTQELARSANENAAKAAAEARAAAEQASMAANEARAASDKADKIFTEALRK